MSPQLFIPLGEGFLLTLGIIVGFGPQNSFILQQGIKREFVLMVALLASLAHLCLITLGAGGVGSFFVTQPVLVEAITLACVAFLGVYGCKSFKTAFTPQPVASPTSPQKLGKVAVISGLLAVTLLNPGVYLDTLLIIGGSATRYAPSPRLFFTLGAISASIIWFFALAFGAGKFANLLRRPAALRLIDVLSGVTMWLCALYMLLPTP